MWVRNVLFSPQEDWECSYVKRRDNLMCLNMVIKLLVAFWGHRLCFDVGEDFMKELTFELG